MSRVYDKLEEIKTALSTVTDVKTCKIGLERGIGSKDAPFIRIVPITNAPDERYPKLHESLTFQVIFGFDTKNREYEQLHEQYFNMSQEIKEKCPNSLWIQTVTDEDQVKSLKTAVIEFSTRVDICSQ